jgi:glycosyltransferase involved in cell wall biosynthesis
LTLSFTAIELAAKRVPALRLVAFGAELVADQLPLPRRTSFHHLPGQDSVRNLYASCDVWLCGSHSDGFGLLALEAMACRCSVVSANAGGPGDFIKPGRNGYLVSVGDEKALADRLVGVLSLNEIEW